MADPTLQETLFKLSVRKFMLNQIETLRGKKVYFDRQYSIPKDDANKELTNWIVVSFGGIDISTVSVCPVEILCFSRKDEGGLVLSALRDIVVDIMVDISMPDGCRRIPYLSETEEIIGGILCFIDTKDGGIQYGADGTNYKVLQTDMKWGTK